MDKAVRFIGERIIQTGDGMSVVSGKVRLIWEVEREARCATWHDEVSECVAAEPMYWDAVKARAVWSPCQRKGYTVIAEKREAGAVYPVVLCRKHTMEWETSEVERDARALMVQRWRVGLVVMVAVGLLWAWLR